MTLFAVIKSLIMALLYVSMMLFADTCGGASSLASHRRLGSVQTTVECATDIAGTFVRPRLTKSTDVKTRRPATKLPNIHPLFRLSRTT